MFAEWAAECAADDPVLVVPWNDPAGTAEFIDLRANPYDLYLVPEAEEHPALMQALRALNAGRSPVFTAKCDVWAMSDEEVENLRFNLVVDEASASTGFAAYIDMLWRDRAVFVSRHRQEQMLDRMVRLAAVADIPLGAMECVLRPSVLDLAETQEGYAVTLYVKGLGSDAEHAYDVWSRTLEEVVKIVRGREFLGR